MFINGREINLLYTVRAYIAINEWVANNENKSAAEARLRQACYMHEAYIKANHLDEKPMTIEELEDLPVYEMVDLFEEMDKAVQEGSVRTVEAQEVKKKEEEKTGK